VSIHADDEFSLRTGLEIELHDVVPGDGLADAVITRYRSGRRRRVAGAIGLVIVIAGIGVPLGLGASTVPGPGHTVLHLAPYTLILPGQYQLVAAQSASCRPSGTGVPGSTTAGDPQAGPDVAAAADPSGHCIALLLTPPFRPGAAGNGGDPNIPPGAQGITVGRYHAWVLPDGYGRPGGVTLVIEEAAGGKVTGQIQDLVINSTGLSRAALLSAVSAGLSQQPALRNYQPAPAFGA
jgi:hypothetical protein